MAMREAHGSSACDFLPTTYVLPADAEACHNAMMRERGAAWIVKPIASSRGRGISIVQQPHQLPMDDVVVSRYVSNPLLIDGFKFDLRIYVAVTSFDPLRCYVFEEGLARFSTEPYQANGGAGLKNLFMHLTNYSINKHSAHFVPNSDANADDHGNKWSLSALKRCLARNGVDVEALWSRIDALVVRTLISVEPSVTAACRRYCSHRNCAFELFGFDVLLDDQLKPWLLEVNLSPSLAVDSPLDLKVKTRMLSDLLTLASIVPYDREAHRQQQKRRDKVRYERLARGEPAAKQTFRQRGGDHTGTMGHLSLEAQRAVNDMDAEASRAGGWRRLFPSANGHAHRHFFAQERPLNTVLVDVLRQRALESHAATDLDAIARAAPQSTTTTLGAEPPPPGANAANSSQPAQPPQPPQVQAPPLQLQPSTPAPQPPPPPPQPPPQPQLPGQPLVQPLVQPPPPYKEPFLRKPVTTELGRCDLVQGVPPTGTGRHGPRSASAARPATVGHSQPSLLVGRRRAYGRVDANAYHDAEGHRSTSSRTRRSLGSSGLLTR
jgi:hypothetical protein